MTDEARNLDSLLEDLRFAMLTTPGPEGLASRPVTCAHVDNDRVSFLVDRTADWVAPLEATVGEVNVAFADPGKNTYVSLSGRGLVERDVEEVRRLWTPMAKPFFDGPDDPTVGVLHVDVASGQWWDGSSGRVANAILLLKAAVTRDESDAGGDQGPVEVR